MGDDPVYLAAIKRFDQVIEDAQRLGLKEPTAMALATVSAEGRPSVRIVLMRGHDARGPVFYTNSQSRKGQELATNPQAALCFYWDPAGLQVRIEGRVEPVESSQSDLYWSTRPRESQIAAWASQQSPPLRNETELKRQFEVFQQEFSDQPITRPDHWFGYRLVPDRIEFWASRPARLHERILYEKSAAGWTVTRLQP